MTYKKAIFMLETEDGYVCKKYIQREAHKGNHRDPLWLKPPTQSHLLALLMGRVLMTWSHLTYLYGDGWVEPMMDLIALKVASARKDGLFVATGGYSKRANRPKK